MQSKAKTVPAYLAELPPDRRASVQAVRKVILKNLDKDYEEGMQYGMIAYYVPHRVFPAGYHCDPSKPLCFAALASQKNALSLYLMCIYGDEKHRKQFQQGWAKSGKKLDVGKSCIRFKKAEDLALDVIGEAIAGIPAKEYVERYLTIRKVMDERTVKGPASKAATAKKIAAALKKRKAKA